MCSCGEDRFAQRREGWGVWGGRWTEDEKTCKGKCHGAPQLPSTTGKPKKSERGEKGPPCSLHFMVMRCPAASDDGKPWAPAPLGLWMPVAPATTGKNEYGLTRLPALASYPFSILGPGKRYGQFRLSECISKSLHPFSQLQWLQLACGFRNKAEMPVGTPVGSSTQVTIPGGS